MPHDEAEGLEARLEAALLGLLADCPPGKSVDPAAVARAVGGSHPDGWGPLMKDVRRIALRLAGNGRLVILRKGQPVDPAALKGIYRLALPDRGRDRVTD
jgi:hypothetical protein